jgi:hypothetical protein
MLCTVILKYHEVSNQQLFIKLHYNLFFHISQ